MSSSRGMIKVTVGFAASGLNDSLEQAGFGPDNLFLEANSDGSDSAATHYVADWTDSEDRWTSISQIVSSQAGADHEMIRQLSEDTDPDPANRDNAKVLDQWGLQLRTLPDD
jgi:hypothetical protein